MISSPSCLGRNNEIANISFGLYAAEDIIAADGTKIPINGLIEIISFDAGGHAICQTDLPLGKYYLQERSTDSHYILSDAKFPFEFAYAGQDKQDIPAYQMQFPIDEEDVVSEEYIPDEDELNLNPPIDLSEGIDCKTLTEVSPEDI